MRRFRPQWIILITMIALSIALILYFIDQSPQNVARQLASRLETTSEQEVEEIIDQLRRLGPAGIPELARNLGATRRIVVLGARGVLEQEFQQWTQQEPQKSALSHYLLAKSLAENIDQFGPTSRLTANSFAQRILRALLTVPTQSQVAKRFETIRFCEEIIQKTEGERSVAGNPARLNEMYKIAGSGKLHRLYPPDPYDEQLILAANERNRSMFPGRSRFDVLDYPEFYDPYSNSRAELLYAVHQSRLQSEMGQKTPPLTATRSPALISDLERLAYQQATMEPIDNDTFKRSQVAERIASQFLPQKAGRMPAVPRVGETPAFSGASLPGVGETLALPEERLPLLTGLDDHENYPVVVVEKTDLGQTPLDEIPNLSTPDLIRLLQHPNRAVQAIAEKRLRDRDNFRDEHIALAYRLHHPDTEIRKGMIDALIRVPSIQPVPWVLEMLRDGDPEVRLVAVTFIATAKDKTLFQEVLNQAKKDDSPRINGLIDKLERIQRL